MVLPRDFDGLGGGLVLLWHSCKDGSLNDSVGNCSSSSSGSLLGSLNPPPRFVRYNSGVRRRWGRILRDLGCSLLVGLRSCSRSSLRLSRAFPLRLLRCLLLCLLPRRLRPFLSHLRLLSLLPLSLLLRCLFLVGFLLGESFLLNCLLLGQLLLLRRTHGRLLLSNLGSFSSTFCSSGLLRRLAGSLFLRCRAGRFRDRRHRIYASLRLVGGGRLLGGRT